MLTNSVRRYLSKATYLTSDLTGGTDGGLLSTAQAKAFIRVATNWSAVLSEARQEFSDSPSFEVPRFSFHGTRILQGGATNAPEGDRVPSAARQKPTTGNASLTTILYKGEVPVSEETLEDNIEGAAHADTIMQGVAEAVGRDLEEVALKSKTSFSDALFLQQTGWLDNLDTNAPAAQKLTFTGVVDVETVLDGLIEAVPPRYRRDPSQLRLFVPWKVQDAYERAMAARGTGLGDQVIINGIGRATYRSVPIIPVPLLSGNEAGLGNIDFTKYAFCTNPKNLIVGFHRRVRILKWYDPREGSWSFLPSVRMAVQIGEVDATSFSKTIDSI